MAFAQHVWNQLKSLTADELIAALKRDGYRQDPASAGATIAYIKAGNPSKRIVIHYHPARHTARNCSKPCSRTLDGATPTCAVSN